MTRDISTFLPEVLARICVLLSRSDLRSVRLLSHTWNNAAQRILFETVFLRINLQSFERLQDISRHEKLRKYVRIISYDGRTFGSSAARQGFQDWLRCSAGTGLGLAWEAKDEFLAQFSIQQLEKYYFNYCHYLFAQDHILRRGNEKQMLIDALQKLPGLSGVQYTVISGAETGISRKVPELSSLSTLAQAILAEPEDYHRYLESEGRFWNLLQSAYLSGHAQQLKSIRGSHLDLERWNAAAKSFRDCYRALPALHYLSLEFGFSQHGDGETIQLADMIAHASSLTSLRLSFDNFSWDDPSAIIHLPQVINDGLQWKHLRSLSLQAVATTEGFLRNLLLRHSESLRSLELSNINLNVAAIPDQYGRGSWIHFIQFLNETMSLEHIRFDGCFSNLWDEGWVSRDADWERAFGVVCAPAQYSKDCLKYRIERFIIHTGPCPFAARMGKVDTESYDAAYDYHGLPWVFEEDNSWRFEHRLIQ
ncbi:hypothetical protein B0O99DRAFT_511971 [Bisporella sp. PMI_857]|nr:hypothetical protein B0O99DRAFT_511971 [Bisporella sp. PMI_857]